MTSWPTMPPGNGLPREWRADMTRDEYYAALEKRWEETDKEDRNAIHAYNEWKRELRHLLDEEE